MDGNCATEFDGCGQYLWVCPVGVAMVPDGNPKKLEPMHRAIIHQNRSAVKQGSKGPARYGYPFLDTIIAPVCSKQQNHHAHSSRLHLASASTTSPPCMGHNSQLQAHQNELHVEFWRSCPFTLASTDQWADLALQQAFRPAKLE